MSPDRDSGRLGDDDHEMDERDDESPRSIFSALWFRALLAVLVLGVLAAVAVPYVLDFATSPSLKSTPTKSVATAPAAPVTAAPATPPAPPAAAETPAAPAENAAASTAPPSSVAEAAKPEAAKPEAAPATAAPAKSKAGKPAATKSRTTVVAKAVDTPKPAPKAEAQKPAPKAEKSAPKADKAAPKEPDKAAPKEAAATKTADAAKPSPAKAAGGGPYWVQVGAFKDAETAKRLAARLREGGFYVEESTTTSGASRSSSGPAASPRTADRYDVLVSGASTADIDAKLARKGLKGESTANGIVVRPSLALREAVALSRDLADAGLSVQVRRIGGPAAAVAAAAPAPAAATTLHRVRVGGFTDRAAAADAMKRLEAKGLTPFHARGNE